MASEPQKPTAQAQAQTPAQTPRTQAQPQAQPQAQTQAQTQARTEARTQAQAQKQTRTKRTRSKLWPGEPGTKKLLSQFGDRLVCVRYLYDPSEGKRFTTVELIVDEGPWKPGSRPPLEADTVVALRIVPEDWEVEAEIQAAGGTWSPGQKVWRLWYDRVIELGLKSRIVPLLDSREVAPPAGGNRTKPVSTYKYK